MTAGRWPVIDLVIAVHDSTRPLDRAIRSALGSIPQEDLRVSVVCHNIRRAEVVSALSEDARRSTRFLELFDGIHSAAGPFQYGLAAAEAKYVSIMGSDDYLEPGALAAWVSRAERFGLTAVIPRERLASGRKVRTPPVRVGRSSRLSGSKDRLAYRTAPLGLIRREAVARLNLRFATGIGTGEDQLFSAALWFSGEPIAYARRDPGYVVGEDAIRRTTFIPRALDEELRFVDELIVDQWFEGLDERDRSAIATKLIRVHVFASVTSRAELGQIGPRESRYLHELLTRLRAHCPRAERPLSLADRRFIDQFTDRRSTPEQLRILARARRRFGSPATIVTRDPAGLLATEGPLRMMTASALL